MPNFIRTCLITLGMAFVIALVAFVVAVYVFTHGKEIGTFAIHHPMLVGWVLLIIGIASMIAWVRRRW